MSKHTLSRFPAAAVLVLALAITVSASAGAASRASATSVYSRLSADVHAMTNVSSSQIRTDLVAYEKRSRPCMTQAFTTVIAAQSPGATNAVAAKVAYKALLYEAALQMVMKASRPLMTPYLRALKLLGTVSVLTRSQRTKITQLEATFSEAQTMRTCSDATEWAVAGYSLASEPEGVKLIGRIEQLTSAGFPSGGRFKNISAAQSAALVSSLKLAGARFKVVIKQIDGLGVRWLAGVILNAQTDAARQPTTTTSS